MPDALKRGLSAAIVGTSIENRPRSIMLADKRAMRIVVPPDDLPIAPGHWLDHLVGQAGAVCAGHDPEAVHQIRVAVARLRILLRLGGDRGLQDDLRWLRDQAAAVRDLDVQLEQHPPLAWARRLRGRRAQAAGKLVVALEGDRFASIVDALRTLPLVERNQARRVAARLARRALASGRDLRGRSRDISVLHELRCAVRRVRYALEWLGEEPTSIVALQQALGDVCDRHVALEGLRRHGARHIARYQRRVERELERLLDGALAAWKRARRELKEIRHAPSSSAMLKPFLGPMMSTTPRALRASWNGSAPVSQVNPRPPRRAAMKRRPARGLLVDS